MIVSCRRPGAAGKTISSVKCRIALRQPHLTHLRQAASNGELGERGVRETIRVRARCAMRSPTLHLLILLQTSP